MQQSAALTDLRARVERGEDVSPAELAAAIDALHAARLPLLHALAAKGAKGAGKGKGRAKKAKAPKGESGVVEQVELI